MRLILHAVRTDLLPAALLLALPALSGLFL
jgi:hypothetical protein